MCSVVLDLCCCIQIHLDTPMCDNGRDSLMEFRRRGREKEKKKTRQKRRYG